MSARLSALRQTTSMQQAAVLKAKRSLAESDEKRRMVKKWNRDFDTRADPLTKKLESLRAFLDHDLPKGISFLANAQQTLEAYTQISVPSAEPGPETPQEPPLL
jgi:hypothetical protein